MPDYRRNRIPGGTYFFTVNLLDRSSDLLVSRIEALRRRGSAEVAARRPAVVAAPLAAIQKDLLGRAFERSPLRSVCSGVTVPFSHG
jgi:hypothetical protein